MTCFWSVMFGILHSTGWYCDAHGTAADLHRWADMGVYFSDDEMLEQAELFLQTDRTMRKDVFSSATLAETLLLAPPVHVADQDGVPDGL